MGVTKVYQSENKSTQALNGRLNGQPSERLGSGRSGVSNRGELSVTTKPGGRNISAGGVSRRILIQLFLSPAGDTWTARFGNI